MLTEVILASMLLYIEAATIWVCCDTWLAAVFHMSEEYAVGGISKLVSP